MKQITLGNIRIGNGSPCVLIAGPCVIEDNATTAAIAASLKSLSEDLSLPLIFKASYDKANRTSKDSYRGPGIKEGLRILEEIKKEYAIPVLSDVHRFEEIDEAAQVLDIIQIPAFLSRQTDFVTEVARTGKIVNIKKGQFLAPWDVMHILDKALATGNDNIMVTERGVSFGYNNLVADMCAIPIMREYGYPVVFDATHSVQRPGGAGASSGGNRDMAVHLAKAATAVGIDGLFLEVHHDPECALCDGSNSLSIASLPELLTIIKQIDGIIKSSEDFDDSEHEE